jgi:S1-C subfamily serine protease
LLGHGLVLTSADAVTLRAGTGEAVPLDAIEVSGGGVRARASLLVVIDGAGLALLHAEGFADAPPVRMGDSSALEAGAPVYVASEPGERDHLASGVVIGEVDRELSNASLRYVETTLAAPPSSSGAPVFDDQGEVVGIAAGNGSEGLVFLRVEDVKRVLRPLESAR